MCGNGHGRLNPIRDEGICDHCGGPNPLWTVDAASWEAVTGFPGGSGGGFWCPSCFLNAAVKKIPGRRDRGVIWWVQPWSEVSDDLPSVMRDRDAAARAAAEYTVTPFWHNKTNAARVLQHLAPEGADENWGHRAYDTLRKAGAITDMGEAADEADSQ